MRTEIRALQRRLGLTTILVTHDQEEAMRRTNALRTSSAAIVAAAGAPERVEFVDEDDARGGGAGLLEEIADASGAECRRR